MHITDKLQQDLSWTELCALTYQGKISVGWFGDRYISVDGFEGSEYVDVISQKLLNELSIFFNPPRQHSSLQEWINGALCLEKLNDIYDQKEQLPLIHLIFLKFIELLKNLFDDGSYFADKCIIKDVRFQAKHLSIMKLPKSLCKKEFPNFRVVHRLNLPPLDFDWALKNKDKAWVKSNIPREAVLQKFGPKFFKNSEN